MDAAWLSRRAMLACGATFVLAPVLAHAESSCSLSGDGEFCTAGVPRGSVEEFRQLKPHWCWAACIQTIFATHGFAVPQDRIVQRLFGDQTDRSATGPQIIRAIDGRWQGDRGKDFDAKSLLLWDRFNAFERPDAIALAVRELSIGNPLIMATDRHTLVLTSMTFSEDANGKIAVDSLVVRDPWPTIPNRHPMPIAEIPKSGFLCGVHVMAA